MTLNRFLATLALVTAVACGDDASTDSDTDTTGTAGTGGTTCVDAVADCAAFCATAVATCPTEYPVEADCATECATWPVGCVDETGGDSWECRNYHLGAAAADAATHCPHAGPDGGGVCS